MSLGVLEPSGFIREVFSLVCAQNAAHTWAPGGQMLPLCQRCTGFYTGAAIALALLILFRPLPRARFRWIHFLLVLAMTPFGFHLIAQGEILRTASGQWFGFGVAGLLWLLPSRLPALKANTTAGGAVHFLLGMTSMFLLPPFALWGGTAAAIVIPWIALTGLLAIAGLALANLWTVFSWIVAPRREARNG
jgi:uncharacterized membrane protein